jgi:hypothetical protein
MRAVKLTETCPLCKDPSNVFYSSTRCLYYICMGCDAVFLSRSSYLTTEEEKKRYLEHNNDVDDPGYQKFVSPAVSFVIENFLPEKHKGLDFGAGTGPVISRMLEDKSFTVKKYDPFFHPDKECLNNKYDFIICCEVAEHFYRPYDEFSLLSGLLHEKGKLVCMTSVYDKGIPFDSWYYKNDPTHVFIYQQKTFQWIKDKLRFTDLRINGNLIILSK